MEELPYSEYREPYGLTLSKDSYTNSRHKPIDITFNEFIIISVTLLFVIDHISIKIDQKKIKGSKVLAFKFVNVFNYNYIFYTCNLLI